MKKILSYLLALAIVLSLGTMALAEEYPLLRIMVRQNTCSDVEMVSEAISEITREKLGCEVELVFINASDYNSKIPLMIASDEQMDIGYDAIFLDYVNRSRTGAYLDITNLLNQYGQELLEIVEPSLWLGATVDGAIYGVPTKKEIAEQWGFMISSDFVERHGLDLSDYTEYEDLESILELLKAEGRSPYMVTGSSTASFGNAITIGCLTKYDVIETVDYAAVVAQDDPETVVNYYETEDFKEFVYLMRDWYQKGYIVEDIATRENYDDYMNEKKTGLIFCSYSPLTEINQGILYGEKLSYIPITPVTVTNTSSCGSVNCVYAKSENPELAVKFLNLWNTMPEIKNLITYGIENVHYTLTEDKKVKYLPDYQQKYSNSNYRVGNMFISYLLDGDTDDKWDKYIEFNNASRASHVLAFRPDVTDMEDKLAVIKSIVTEYAGLLCCGCVDPDVYLPMFLEKLEEAGIDEVIGEYQAQYDEWREAK